MCKPDIGPVKEKGKNCIHCGNHKPLSEYYKHSGMADGHLNACKDCHKDKMRKNHRQKILDPEWREKERKRSREKYHKYKYRSKRRKANDVVSNAVRDGKIIPSEVCENCGHDFSEFRREAHHADYAKPLNIEWLCSLCHGKKHRID